MRSSVVITFSLPPVMAKQAQKLAKKQFMTLSELIRTALRNYLKELEAGEIVGNYKKEKQEGKLKELKGSLIDLIV